MLSTHYDDDSSDFFSPSKKQRIVEELSWRNVRKDDDSSAETLSVSSEKEDSVSIMHSFFDTDSSDLSDNDSLATTVSVRSDHSADSYIQSSDLAVDYESDETSSLSETASDASIEEIGTKSRKSFIRNNTNTKNSGKARNLSKDFDGDGEIKSDVPKSQWKVGDLVDISWPRDLIVWYPGKIKNVKFKEILFYLLSYII